LFGHVSVARKMSSLKPEMLLMPRSIENTRRILKSKNNCLKSLNSTCRSRISNLHALSQKTYVHAGMTLVDFRAKTCNVRTLIFEYLNKLSLTYRMSTGVAMTQKQKLVLARR